MPWGGAAGAAGALFSAGPADFFNKQRVDSAIGVVARDPCKAAIDYETYAVDRDRSFSHVRGDNNLPLIITGYRRILIVWRQLAKQREKEVSLGLRPAADRLDRAVDFVSARHENEDVTRIGRRIFREGVSCNFPDRRRTQAQSLREVVNIDRKCSAL